MSADETSAAGRKRVRVLVVDDHPVVRAGMVALLSESPDIEIVAEASDGAQALVAVTQHDLDVVLMDLRMPVLDGVAATTAIHALPHAPHVLILTTYDTDADIRMPRSARACSSARPPSRPTWCASSAS